MARMSPRAAPKTTHGVGPVLLRVMCLPLLVSKYADMCADFWAGTALVSTRVPCAHAYGTVRLRQSGGPLNIPCTIGRHSTISTRFLAYVLRGKTPVFPSVLRLSPFN